MTTSSFASGKLSLRKRRREKLVATKSNQDDQHRTEMIGKHCRRIPIPSFSPIDDQIMPSLRNVKNSHGLKDERSDDPQTVTKAKNGALLCDDLHSIPKCNDAKNEISNIHLMAEQKDAFQISVDSGPLCDSKKAAVVDSAGCQSSRNDPVSDAAMNFPHHSSCSDISKKNDRHHEILEKASDSEVLVPEVAQLYSKGDDAADNRLNCSTENNSDTKTSDSELAQTKNKSDAADNNLTLKTGSMTVETKIKEYNNQEQPDIIMTKELDQNETTNQAHNKQKPLSNYFSKSVKQSVIDLVDSPSLRDFNVPRSKYLADKEAVLVKKHANNLERSKNGTLKKNSRKGIHAKGSLRNLQRKQCTLCLTCSCSRGSALQSLEDGAISENQNPLLGLARSDAEIERALIGRLARLEKSASWFDHLCSKVDRELKRHRNKMKASMKESDHEDKPKFLSDVDAVDERRLYSSALPNSVVNKAKFKTFSFRKKAQPTLTQMLADSDESDGGEMDKDSTSETMDVDVDDDKEQTCDESNDEQSAVVLKDYAEARSRGKVGRLWNASRDKIQKMKGFNTFDESILMLEKDLDTNFKSEHYSRQVHDYGKDALSELIDAFDVCGTDHDMVHELSNILRVPAEDAEYEKMNQATYSQLSPVSKSYYNTLKSRVDASPEKVAILKCMCPDWEENIRFALRQKPSDVREALVSVRKKQEFLSKAIDMLQKQSVVLDVYEMALNESFHRHDNQDNRDEMDLISHQS